MNPRRGSANAATPSRETNPPNRTMQRVHAGYCVHIHNLRRTTKEHALTHHTPRHDTMPRPPLDTAKVSAELLRRHHALHCAWENSSTRPAEVERARLRDHEGDEAVALRARDVRRRRSAAAAAG